MKKISVILVTVLIVSNFAFAEFDDVNNSHWASEAVERLYENGLLPQTLDGESMFRGDGVFSRYEIAEMLYLNLEYFDNELAEKASQKDLETIKALTEEFAPELSKLGTKTDEVILRVEELEKTVNKTLINKIDSLESNSNGLNISGEYDISQTWNSTQTQKGLNDLSYTGKLFINGAPSKNLKLRSTMSLEKGEKIGVEALELTGNTEYGKLNIFKDNEKMPASFQDPLGLFVAEKVKPTEGIIFKGNAFDRKESHTGMVYKTDAGDFFGLQSGYTLNLAQSNLGTYMLRGTYVEKVKDYFYDTDSQGNEVSESVDQYDRNIALDFSYSNRSLYGMYLEGEIVKAEGMSVPSDELSDTLTLYGMAKGRLGNLLQGEAGFYNSGKDFYSVAGDSNRDVFSTAGDKIKNEADSKAFYLYSKLSLSRNIAFTGLFVNKDTQNEYDEPLLYAEGTGEVNFGSFMKLDGSLEIEREAFIAADDDEVKDAKITFEPAVTVRPQLGTEVNLSMTTEYDPNEKVGENADEDKITNEIQLETDYSKDKILLNNNIELDFGALTDNQADKTYEATITNKLAYDLTDEISLKIFDEFIITNDQGDKNIGGDGIENTFISSANTSLGSASITLLGGLIFENKYANDGDENGELNSGTMFGSVYEYNYNSDTTMTISLLNAGTISRDTNGYTTNASMSYGDKFIEPEDISVEEGTTLNFGVSTKF